MTPASVAWYLGLDLGQRSDPSALAAIELTLSPTPHRDPVTLSPIQPAHLRLRHLHRWPLGTRYPAVAAAVRDFLHSAPFSTPVTLTVDASGPGLSFLDFFTTQSIPATLIRLIITASGNPAYHSGFYHVSRTHLLANLATLVQQGTLTVAPKLKEAPALRAELATLQHDYRSKAHDDLAMATALAAWQASRANRTLLGMS